MAVSCVKKNWGMGKPEPLVRRKGRGRGGGDPAFWEEPASWEGTCILGGNYFFKLII